MDRTMSEANERNKAGRDVEMADVIHGVVPNDKIEEDGIVNCSIKYHSEAQVEPEELSPFDSKEQQAVESRSFLKPQVR